MNGPLFLDGWPRREPEGGIWVPHVSGLHVGLAFLQFPECYYLRMRISPFPVRATRQKPPQACTTIQGPNGPETHCVH